MVLSLTTRWLTWAGIYPKGMTVYLYKAGSMLVDPGGRSVWFHSFSPRSYTECLHSDPADHFTTLSPVWNVTPLPGGVTQGPLGLCSLQQLAVILCLSLFEYYFHMKLLCYFKAGLLDTVVQTEECLCTCMCMCAYMHVCMCAST